MSDKIHGGSVSMVPEDTIRKCIDALLKWKKGKSDSEKLQLLEEDEYLYLVLTLKKIPPVGKRRALKIPIPYPIHSPALSEICLIFDDRSNSDLTSESAKKKLKSEDITISKVLKFSKLKTDYREYEKRRKLCNSYDLFLADKRIAGLLPKFLGKYIFSNKTIPIPVDLKRTIWKHQIDKICSSALLYIRMGTCSVLRVARLSMEKGEMLQNVVASVIGLTELVPNKWGGIRSLHLKLSGSLALPIYQTLPDVKLKIEGIKTDISNIEEGDLKNKKKKVKTFNRAPSALKQPGLLDVMIES